MVIAEYIFWFCMIALAYTYLGYPFLLKLFASIFKAGNTIEYESSNLPKVTHLIAAYNEGDIIEHKVQNSLGLDYPKGKMETIFITDGSTDDTVKILAQYPDIICLHDINRQGKAMALKRGVEHSDTEILIMSDANTQLNKTAIRELVLFFQNENIGAVAGEKKIIADSSDNASASGESIYWQYESLIKRNESKLSSTVGAVGELYAVRKELVDFAHVGNLPDDLMISMNVIRNGYKIAYTSRAFANEYPSANLREEMKRKARISAQSIRAIPRLIEFLNPLKYGWFSWFLFSHKIMRWTLAPFALIGALLANIYITGESSLYNNLLYIQLFFYLLAFIGFLLRGKELKIKGLFVPFYFVFAHVCTFFGYFKAMKSDQLSKWERSQRRTKY